MEEEGTGRSRCCLPVSVRRLATGTANLRTLFEDSKPMLLPLLDS